MPCDYDNTSCSTIFPSACLTLFVARLIVEWSSQVLCPENRLNTEQRNKNRTKTETAVTLGTTGFEASF